MFGFLTISHTQRDECAVLCNGEHSQYSIARRATNALNDDEYVLRFFSHCGLYSPHLHKHGIQCRQICFIDCPRLDLVRYLLLYFSVELSVIDGGRIECRLKHILILFGGIMVSCMPAIHNQRGHRRLLQVAGALISNGSAPLSRLRNNPFTTITNQRKQIPKNLEFECDR